MPLCLSVVGCHPTTWKLQEGRAGAPGSPAPPAPSRPMVAPPWGSLASACMHVTHHRNAQATEGPLLPSAAHRHAAGTRGGTRNLPSPYLLLATLPTPPPSASAAPAPDSPTAPRTADAAPPPTGPWSFFLPALAPLNSQCPFQKRRSSEGWGSEMGVPPHVSLGRRTSQGDEQVCLLPQGQRSFLLSCPKVFRITISDR